MMRRTGKWMVVPGVCVLALLALPVAAPVRADVGSWITSINPFLDTYEKFEGKYIDTIEPGAWARPTWRDEVESGGRRDALVIGREEREVGSAIEPEEGQLVSEAGVGSELPSDDVLIRLQGGYVEMPAFEAYLNELAQRLLAESPITGVPLKVRIWARDGVGEASAFPEGTVVIPVGLLPYVETEDELVALLAHETSHVVLGHHDSDWLDVYQNRILGAAEVAFGALNALSEKMGMTDKGGISELSQIAGVADSVYQISQDGLLPSWGREDEEQADLLGIDLMVRAGFDPNEVFTFLDRLQQWEESGGDPWEAKRADVQARIEKSSESGELGTAIAAVFESARLEFDAFLADEIEDNHPDTSDRYDALLAYYEREYEDEEDDFPEASSKNLAAVQASPASQAVFRNYDHLREARKYLVDGDTDKAGLAAKKAISGPTSGHARPRLAFFEIRKEEGKLSLARKNLEIALRDPRAPYPVYKELIALHLEGEKFDEAKDVLDRAWVSFEEAPQLYPEFIDLNGKMGNLEEMNRLLVECRVRGRSMVSFCEKTAKQYAEDPEGS